ncbi:MAG: RnfH family protein [Pseudomonadota bacterium]|nr:RnfH family protein [Pseudomonadota bacterium]
MEKKNISIEVVLAFPERQESIMLSVLLGTTARQAAEMSGLSKVYSSEGLKFKDCPLGVFGKRVSDERLLKSGDRLELYRPLLNKPGKLRLQRAEIQKKFNDKTE